MSSSSSFKLDDEWVQSYANKTPGFGFNGLGELVYMRTYSRIKDSDGTNEKWWETVRRVVEGCYNLQKNHIDNLTLGWDSDHAQRSAREMYDRMFNMKFLPLGEVFGLWELRLLLKGTLVLVLITVPLLVRRALELMILSTSLLYF